MEKVTVETLQDVEENELNGFYDDVSEDNFKPDFIKAVMGEYDLSNGQAELVYNMSYEEGHSSGNSEIVNYAYDLADFARELLNT